ncbi:hypothetical protein A2U01_0087045, partial [Trifolium medium]|nr:hypothetical protein [Trifolium medium]
HGSSAHVCIAELPSQAFDLHHTAWRVSHQDLIRAV